MFIEVKKFFDSWMNSIQNPITRNFNYYDEYTTEIKIDIEDIKDRKRYEVTMHESYPKNVGQIQVGYDQKEIMKMQVSINYKYWTSRAFAAPKETKESPWSRFLKVPTINGRELVSQPSAAEGPVPDRFNTDFTGFQQEFNQFEYSGRA